MQQKNIALVTGASSGIGAALSIELVKRGWTVIGVARSADKLMQMQNDSFIPMVCDVSKKEDIKAVSRQLLQQNLYPSLFFLNAGISGESAAEDPAKFDCTFHEKIMQVNYFGVLNWIEFWEKPCQQHGGAKFIATSSITAFFAMPSGSAYSASKAAIAKAFEGLALTYSGTNLQFCVVYPGPVDTPGLRAPRRPPFTWKPEKMAKYMVDFALSSKTSGAPFYFYNMVMHILHGLPTKFVRKLLASK